MPLPFESCDLPAFSELLCEGAEALAVTGATDAFFLRTGFVEGLGTGFVEGVAAVGVLLTAELLCLWLGAMLDPLPSPLPLPPPLL